MTQSLAFCTGDIEYLKMLKVLVIQSCLTLCDSMDCSLPGSSVHRILQVRILEWVAMPSSGGSSQPRDQNQVSYIVDRFFYHLSYPGTWETGVYKIYSESEVTQLCLTLCNPITL